MKFNLNQAFQILDRTPGLLSQFLTDLDADWTSPNERKTLVILTQDQIKEDDKSRKEVFVGCSNGWTFWLANLKAWLEHGILLNERHDDAIKVPDGNVWVNM